MIATVLLVAAVVVVPTILVLGVLFVLGSAVAVIVDGAAAGFLRPFEDPAES